MSLRHGDSINRNVMNVHRQESQGHRRSLSNQTISIRNEGPNNEIVLKSSMSDQNLIFQNDNYSDASGQYNQSMFISRHDQGGSSNILVSNETVGTGEHRVNSTRIETGNGGGGSGGENNSMICVRNASSAHGDGANHSSVFYKRSRNAALPKIPTMQNYKECEAQWRGIKVQPSLQSSSPLPPRRWAESSASLDGFQPATNTATAGAAFGRSQAKYVNEVLLPRGPSPMCPSPSYAAGTANLSRQSAASSVRAAEARYKEVMTRSFNEPIIGAAQDLVEYDSDTGWKRRSMPINILSSLAFEEPIRQESLPISKVSAEETEARDKDSRNLIESMPKAVPSTHSPYRNEVSAVEPRANIVKRSEAGKRRRRKSQSGHDVSGKEPTTSVRGADLNFSEYVGRRDRDCDQKNMVPRNAFSQSQQRMMDDADLPKEVYNSADSIKNIIDEVRSELLAQPRKDSYLSDESPQQEPAKKGNYNEKEIKNKLSRNANARSDKDAAKEMKMQSDGEDDISDDVFVNAPRRGRHASFSTKDKKVVYPKRRTSSLEDLAQFQKRIAQTSRSKSVEGSSRKTSSSVSINETPQVFTYDNGSNSFKALRSIARRPPTNSTSSSLNNGLALLNTKPSRGSLKKIAASPSSKSSVPVTPSKPSKPSKPLATKSAKKSPKRGKKSTTNSSDYDPRDRRRDGNGNERDMYRYRDRGDRDKGELSDRDQKDSRDDSFNRSLSNTEGTPDDKIGKFWMTCPSTE